MKVKKASLIAAEKALVEGFDFVVYEMVEEVREHLPPPNDVMRYTGEYSYTSYVLVPSKEHAQILSNHGGVKLSAPWWRLNGEDAPWRYVWQHTVAQPLVEVACFCVYGRADYLLERLMRIFGKMTYVK